MYAAQRRNLCTLAFDRIDPFFPPLLISLINVVAVKARSLHCYI